MVRRRKATRRLLVAVVPAIIVIAAIVALLIILGGRAEKSGASSLETTTSTAAASSPSAAASVIVAIDQDGTIPAVVVLSRTADGGVALGLPGLTLVKTSDEGFPTVGDLFSHKKTEELVAGLDRDLGTDLTSAAGISWAGLLKALGQAGSAQTWQNSIGGDASDAVTAAGALLSMVGLSASSAGSAAWQQLEISGDAAGLRSFVKAVAAELTAGSWAAAVLPGEFKENLNAKWYEPDTSAAKALLKTGTAPAGAKDITLGIQNGSGALDAAQSAGTLLESLGYKMLPFQNASGFPDVAKTTIAAAPDALAAAAKVREKLGVGTVSADDSLASGHISVIVGKDFTPSTTGG
jgi:hypothetical protein